MKKHIRAGLIFAVVFILVSAAIKFHVEDTKEPIFIEGGNIQHAIDTNQW